MTLPAPNLDDRRFQDLVDDGKRLVQQRCPEWTNHNVSDPGVTLIETFAWMTDQLLYRLNQVPDKVHVKLLELIGIRLFPPNAARTGVTFWLSAPQEEPVRVPAGTQVATARAAPGDVVVFTTTTDLDVPPASVAAVRSSIEDGVMRDHDDALAVSAEFHCFAEVPAPGDTLLVGLTQAIPSCAVVLRFDCDIEGIGVDPTNPPLAWEAWDGEGWSACEVDRDETGGLNRAGDVVLHVPATHTASLVSRTRAGWVRARVVEADEEQPAYSASPRIRRVEAFTIGGTAPSVHADLVRHEVLGTSEGIPGQRFAVSRPPVVPDLEPVVLEVADDEGWTAWEAVTDWSGSGPDDAHFVLDAATGEVQLGPAVRLPDGTLRNFGRVPPAGAALRLRSYRTGGGHRGNVTARSLTVLKSSIPYVSRVENRKPAAGGRDGESVENARERGPIALRAQRRAVTSADFEFIASEAALEVARVQCLPAGEPDGGVRVLLVPDATDESGRLGFGQLVPDDTTYERVARALDERRVVGSRIVVEPPQYMGVTIVARLRAHPQTNPNVLQAAALEALFTYFHPLRGGPDGTGWPFGRPVNVGEVYAVLQPLPGLGVIEDALLFTANPATHERSREPVARVELEPNQLVFSVDHQVLVQP